MKQNKKHKQTLERAQYGLESSFNKIKMSLPKSYEKRRLLIILKKVREDIIKDIFTDSSVTDLYFHHSFITMLSLLKYVVIRYYNYIA